LVQWFLSRNADPNISNSYSGQTALTGAVSHASLGILKLLVQHGGDVRRGDLLHAALSSTLPGKREKLDYLLDHGAPVDALQHSASPRLFGHMGPKGLGTALHLAAAQDDAAMATALLGRGADRDVKDTLGRTPLDLAKKYGFQRVMAVLEEA
jgi:ankyrin repeat protein